MSALEKRNELVDDALNQLRQLGQKWQDRLTIDNLRLDERYLVEQLNIWVYLERPWRGTTREFLAIFHYLGSRTLGTLPQHCKIERGDQAKGHSRRGIKTNHVSSQPECGDNQQAVLVDIVKLVKSPDVAVPTLVRLCRFDELQQIWRDTVYYSWVNGLIFLGGLADRVSGPVCRRLPIGLNQLPDQVIQGGTQVMHSVTDDGGNTDRDLLSDLKPVNALSGLRIEIDTDSIWISGAESLPFGIKIADVFFGPFDLGPNTE